jgi:hypothetical protein
MIVIITASTVNWPAKPQQYGHPVAEHPRHFGRDKVIYDPWHYLRVLERKPGALRNGAPFQEWRLPAGVSRVRSRLSGYRGGDREFVDILLAVQRRGMEIVEQACRQALAAGVVRGEIIPNAIARSCDPQPVDTVRLAITIESRQQIVRATMLCVQEVGHGTP